MTKREFYQQILDNIVGFKIPDQDTKYNYERILGLAEKYINSMIKEQSNNQAINPQQFITRYSSIEIFIDKTTNENYIILPKYPPILQDNKQIDGIYIFDKFSGKSVYCIDSKGLMPTLTYEQPYKDMFGLVYFELRGRVVYFSKDLKSLGIEISYLDLVVCDFNMYNDDEELIFGDDILTVAIQNVVVEILQKENQQLIPQDQNVIKTIQINPQQKINLKKR